MSTELRGKSSSQISAVGIMATLGLGMLVGKGKPFPVFVQSELIHTLPWSGLACLAGVDSPVKVKERDERLAVSLWGEQKVNTNVVPPCVQKGAEPSLPLRQFSHALPLFCSGRGSMGKPRVLLVTFPSLLVMP